MSIIIIIFNNYIMVFTQITNSLELLKILNGEFNQYKTYICALDELKKIKVLPNTICIINFERKHDYGVGHWVVVVCKGYKQLVYLDSFGQSPPELILTWMKKFREEKIVTDIFYNKKQIQSFKDEYCGFACLYFVNQLVNTDQELWKVIESINSAKIIKYGKMMYKKYGG